MANSSGFVCLIGFFWREAFQEYTIIAEIIWILILELI